MTDKKVRYAVVGGGQISQQAFMPGVGQTTNSKLAALVTGDPVKSEKLARQYGIKARSYDEYGALLKFGEIDAVYVATPNAHYTQLVVDALGAGINVLLEKPMTASVADAEKVLLAQEASSAKLMIAYRLHHDRAPQRCSPVPVQASSASYALSRRPLRRTSQRRTRAVITGTGADPSRTWAHIL